MSHAEKKAFPLSPSTTVRSEPVEDHIALRTDLSKPALSLVEGVAVHGSTGSPRMAGKQRGYALLLMLVLVTMGILFTLVSQLSVVGMKWAQAGSGNAALLQAKEALIGYVATYRDTHSGEVFGYLPCPDMTATAVTTPFPQGNGVAENVCGSANVTVVGLLPYKTLGLEDLRDSTGVCLWYVVSGTFKNSPKSSAPMNWDTQGQIKEIDANGNTIVTPDDVNGGAAAVIIAAGSPISGQIRTPNSGNICGAVPTEVSAYVESTINGNANQTTTLVQGTAGSATDNDQILSITPKEIFGRIITRVDFKNPLAATPTGHINKLADQIRAVLTTTYPPPINQGGYSQFSGKLIGDVPPTLTLTDTTYQNYFANWRDQFRYVLCNPISPPCLTVAGSVCRGALLFAGQSTSGPRPSTQKPPAMLPAPPNVYLPNYFETGKGLDMLDSANTTFPGNNAYTDLNNQVADRSADVGICLP